MRAKHVFLPVIVACAIAACGSNPPATVSTRSSPEHGSFTVVIVRDNARSTLSQPNAGLTTHFSPVVEAQWLLQPGMQPIPSSSEQWWSLRDFRRDIRSARLAEPVAAPLRPTLSIPVPPTPKPVAPLTVLFEFDRANVSGREQQRILDWLNAQPVDPSTVIEVHGHTDARGGDAYNEALSLRRAQAVKASLVALRVSPTQVRIHGYGEAEPAATNATEDGRALNRRVLVITQGTPRER